MFPGLTEEVCDKAFDITSTAFKTAGLMEVTNRTAGTLVVVNPLASPSSSDPSKVGLDEVEEHLVFSRRIDLRHLMARKFDEIALTKARDIWVLRSLLGPNFSGLDIQVRFPHLYVPGMTKWHGGICEGGVPVAFSGVQGHYDEAAARTFITWAIAICRNSMARVMESDSAFIAGSEAEFMPDPTLTATLPATLPLLGNRGTK